MAESQQSPGGAATTLGEGSLLDQILESAWRGLKYLVDKCDFRENIRVEVLNCSKQDMLDDFEDSPEIPKSGLYRTVYSAEYGTFGGKPFGLMVANYDL